ncbi:MAG: ORF6N domain-containing protein [Flavobacterium sp.]|nr:ORF6N domain-containing protein [Flavobacterium sp.]
MNENTIQNKIYEVRGIKVMLDYDLAALYEVETRVLNQAIKRNAESFPEDFMFRLTVEEWNSLSSQVVMMSSQLVMTSKRPKTALPYVFTEHGVTMLASVLRSSKARKVNIAIVRAFISLRKMVLNIEYLQEQILQLEAKYDSQFEDIYDAIQFLMIENKEIEAKNERAKIGYKN